MRTNVDQPRFFGSRQRGMLKSLVEGAVAPAWTPASPTTSGGVSPHTWHYADSGFIYQDAGITPVASNGDVVGRSVDQGSDSHNVNQTTTSLKPTWRTNVLNGKPVFRIDGIDDFLQGTFTGALSQPYTAILVAKLDAAAVNDGVNHRAIAGSTAAHIQIIQNAATSPDTWAINAGSGVASVAASDSNWNIWTVLFNGGSSQFWLGGVSQATGNAGINNAVGITIGATNTGATSWLGDIAELLIYDPNLSTADMNQLGNYLAAKYGITWSDIP